MSYSNDTTGLTPELPTPSGVSAKNKSEVMSVECDAPLDVSLVQMLMKGSFSVVTIEVCDFNTPTLLWGRGICFIRQYPHNNYFLRMFLYLHQFYKYIYICICK